MLIVGELINATRKSIGEALAARDVGAIRKVAQDQWEAGAHYIDVNASESVVRESESLKWLVKTVQESVAAPCCIDSADPKAIESALSVHQGVAMINSISLEKNRYDAILSLLAGTGSRVVALCMGDEGMPQTCEERVAIAEKLINGLVQNNVPIDHIYVDPWYSRYPPTVASGWNSLRPSERSRSDLRECTPSAGCQTFLMGCRSASF